MSQQFIHQPGSLRILLAEYGQEDTMAADTLIVGPDVTLAAVDITEELIPRVFDYEGQLFSYEDIHGEDYDDENARADAQWQRFIGDI